MPNPIETHIAAVARSIGQATAVRSSCYGTEHRPITAITPEHAERFKLDIIMFADAIQHPDSPWDIHLSNATLLLTTATTPQEQYDTTALLASICIAMMLDLHSQL